MSEAVPRAEAEKRPRYYYATIGDGEAAFLRLDERVSTLETLIGRMETEHAVNVEKQKFIEGRFNKIDVRLDKIDGHMSRLVWLMLTSILGGLMTVVLQGPPAVAPL